MKQQPPRNPGTHQDAGRSSTGSRSISEREVHATSLHSPPVVPHRRYPSLSDDGQPYFPRLQRKKWLTDEAMTSARAAVENDRPVFITVRAIALLAIFIICAVLAATA